MNEVIFLTEAGKNIGIGHVNRCKALSDSFKNRNIQSWFFVRGEIDKDALGVGFENLEWFDEKVIYSLSEKYKNRIFIIDTYLADKKILNNLAHNFKKLIFIIDSTLNYHPSGIILFPSIYADYYVKKGKVKADKVIYGRKYLLFSNELKEEKHFEVREKVKKIIISLGGYCSSEDLHLSINSCLNKFPSAKIFVFGKVKQEFNNDNIYYCGIKTKKEYLDSLYDADFAIVGAGMSLNECSLIGIPAISVCVSKSQYINAKAWEEFVGVKFINLFDKANVSYKIQEELERIENYNFRLLMNKTFQAKIDEKGADRAIDKILKIYDYDSE